MTCGYRAAQLLMERLNITVQPDEVRAAIEVDPEGLTASNSILNFVQAKGLAVEWFNWEARWKEMITRIGPLSGSALVAITENGGGLHWVVVWELSDKWARLQCSKQDRLIKVAELHKVVHPSCWIVEKAQ